MISLSASRPPAKVGDGLTDIDTPALLVDLAGTQQPICFTYRIGCDIVVGALPGAGRSSIVHDTRSHIKAAIPTTMWFAPLLDAQHLKPTVSI